MSFRAFIVVLFFGAVVQGLTGAPKVLNDIAADISSYEKKTVTLVLRLKNIDSIFEKIVFYDSKNIDIEFDISGDKKKNLAVYFLNAHPGLQYHVTFRVTGKSSLGLIHGELISFEPIVIDKIIP